jgi:dihydroorotate dehydrogenase (NAD+) catalytic subunit
MSDPSVRIGGVYLKNPVIAASGTFGFGEEYGELYDASRLGAVCTKGLTLQPREGNLPPRLWETPCGLLNSIGLQNPGVSTFLHDELPRMKEKGLVVIANVWGETVTEYREAVERLSDSSVDAIELNVSCPNVPGDVIGTQKALTQKVMKAVRPLCKRPLWVKLPPDADADVAKVVEAEGADAVCAINTIRGMAVDLETGRPVFAQRFAGLSGPAIKPIALRIVYEFSKTLSIPVIGIGGITTWKDAVEFIMAGAHAVQIGTANFVDPRTGVQIVEGMEAFMKERNLKDWETIRGCAY